MDGIDNLSCFQCVKVIKFESNSQQSSCYSNRIVGCFQCVKVIKFESNSQLIVVALAMVICCFQCVKVIKFESNSQRPLAPYLVKHVVFSVSKL